MDSLQEWPEPVVPVQSISESGATQVPGRYIKPPSQRPSPSPAEDRSQSIPLVDLGSSAPEALMAEACRDWGFFQMVNHGIRAELVEGVRRAWRDFFHLPMEAKTAYANSPRTYEGYGSRLGVEKGAALDWGDYFFLHLLPSSLRNKDRWPARPPSCRRVTEEYGEEMAKLGRRVVGMLSAGLGLGEEYLGKALGGEEVGASLRVNYYPSCPQPHLTLGLSAHSDPGGLTLLLPDDRVTGLQVRRGDDWITVNPAPGAIVVNIGDQIQVMSNAIYKSVEHRVIVSSNVERLSLAFFYNPKSDLLVSPAPLLITNDRPALYKPMTFNEYRMYIRLKGPQGKSQLESSNTETNEQQPAAHPIHA